MYLIKTLYTSSPRAGKHNLPPVSSAARSGRTRRETGRVHEAYLPAAWSVHKQVLQAKREPVERAIQKQPDLEDRYMPACSRYIEMNPVRAFMVREAGGYKHSSCRTEAGMSGPGFLTYDPCCLSPGDTEETRRRKYEKRLADSFPAGEWKNIREAIQRSWAYGAICLRMYMEAALGRRFALGAPGKKPREKRRGEMRIRPRSGGLYPLREKALREFKALTSILSMG